MSAVRTGLLLATLATTVPANAAEINVIAAGAVRGVVGGMIDDYANRAGTSSASPSARPDCCARPSPRARPQT
jgi:ABC-type molybdate transport system substrate-binding protein